MAASAIDEALRNCVAVGADPRKIAILDNFCWGDCERPETLGSLVRAALACRDMAMALGTPFISGKDSLNNEFRYAAPDGSRRSISIPPTLLISALGQIDDVSQAVTMDLKAAGNFLYQVGTTHDELGGSHFLMVAGVQGGRVPCVCSRTARTTFEGLHAAIAGGAVRACHDLSEGGLAVAAAEMAFAGGLGARIFLAQVPHLIELDDDARDRWQQLAPLMPGEELHTLASLSQGAAILLFSESNTRFLCEVTPENREAFERHLAGVPHSLVGEVVDTGRLEIIGIPAPVDIDAGGTLEMRAPLVISADLATLEEAWRRPLAW
jgi:phosphoribosylformylglycinamidine synthase